ncbi:hypothetical protein CHS0354_017334 [Potamilus streckersoni]|uniref:LRAT domain-containing protein n=1 Tax=Potamilus streckersoni TaxID=2493646 RepID=A0AAE0W6T3_9BIVA|nr:hypothetical protein CHS0354_017334 [Potamilus streckersoni]
MGNVLDKALISNVPHSVPKRTGCAYCSTKVRVFSFKQLKPGDHVCQGGRSFLRYLGREQKHLYAHHAIVKNVMCVEGNEDAAVITFIHFYSSLFDNKVKIRETREIRNLKLDELYVVRYRYPKFQPQEILERAQKAIEYNPEYSVSFLNCEHFCNWCVTGEEFSRQIKQVKDVIKNLLGSIGGPVGKIARAVIQFTGITADDLSTLTKTFARHVPTAIQGLSLIVYLVRNVIWCLTLNAKLRAGHICKGCYKVEFSNSWLMFGLFSLPTVISIIVGFLITSNVTLIAVLVTLSAISLTILWGGSPFLRAVRSPFTGQTKRVVDLKEIEVGDVIQYEQWGHKHEAIVSIVDKTCTIKSGTIYIVHYSSNSLFSKREIMEEKLEIDLDKKEVFKHNYTGYNVFPPKEVVQRARQRLGEKKFSVHGNRSCHFCHWAKVNEILYTLQEPSQDKHFLLYLPECHQHVYYDQSVNRPHSTSLICTTWAKVKSDINAGDLIQFKYGMRWHKAVCTEVFATDKDLNVDILVLHYKYKGSITKPKVKEERMQFDLSKDDIYIYQYHPVHRYSRKEVIERARKRIGEKKYNLLFRRSKHLAEEIVLKDKEKAINDPSELDEGDVISFTYWGFRHKAILVSISSILCSSEGKCNITVIHYSWQNIFTKRTVVEETLQIDLKTNDLHKVSFSEYVTYRGNVVVQRARERVGETKFDPFSNTSNHLVHWAKVDIRRMAGLVRFKETEAMVMFHDQDSKETVEENVHSDRPVNISIFPSSGEMVSHMLKTEIMVWEEFVPGHIIEYKYYRIWHQGILTEVLPTQYKIKVIHYGADHLFAVRTITEDTIEVNLKKDLFYIYHPDPEYAFEPQDTIRRAKACLQEQTWSMGNRSVDFCRSCVLNPFAEETKPQLHKEVVRTWEQFIPGRIVDFKYYGLWHQGILTNISPTEKKIKLIHYGTEHLLATRTITEDMIEVNLKRDLYYIYHPRSKYSYTPEEAIQRARSGLKEQTWGIGNRSDNFCRACVLPSFGEKTSTVLRKEVVRSWEQFIPGRIIEYKYYRIWHQGILTEVFPSEKEIKVIHYGAEHIFATRVVMEEVIEVNLKHDLWYIYHPDQKYAYKEKEVIKRAREGIGERTWCEGNRSSDFCRSCILKPFANEEMSLLHKKVVRSWKQFVPGCIVEYKYYWIWHQGILTEVFPKKKKIKIIHYGAKHLFATRTIMEDVVDVNLKLDRIYIYDPDRNYANSQTEILQRAMAGLDEQTWSIGNRSDDFCRECVLKPLHGEDDCLLSKVAVRSWEQFVPGRIVEYKYYWIWHQGILTEVVRNQRKIKVIHYGASHLLATRTITEDMIEVNLKKNIFYIYNPVNEHPYSPEVVIRRAKARLGERLWKRGNRSRDFCRDCVEDAFA